MLEPVYRLAPDLLRSGRVAADSWARELARNTLSSSTPTLFCTPDGQCSETVELRPSRDLVSDPAGHPTVGRLERRELNCPTGTGK